MTRTASALAGIVALGTLAALVIPDAVSRNVVIGEARIIDGDTIEVFALVRDQGPYGHDARAVRGTRIRLHGVDAPEIGQMCGTIHCGLAAEMQLKHMIGHDVVTCIERDRDRYGRIVARCGTARVEDLGASMVATGYAFAYRRYSRDYIDHEEAARAERLGLWRTDFGNPEDWRRGKR